MYYDDSVCLLDFVRAGSSTVLVRFSINTFFLGVYELKIGSVKRSEIRNGNPNRLRSKQQPAQAAGVEIPVV